MDLNPQLAIFLLVLKTVGEHEHSLDLVIKPLYIWDKNTFKNRIIDNKHSFSESYVYYIYISLRRRIQICVYFVYVFKACIYEFFCDTLKIHPLYNVIQNVSLVYVVYFSYSNS